MVAVIRALGLLWVLPVAVLIWLGYIGPALALGWLRWDGWARFGVARFRVVAGDNWHTRRWTGWAGLALPGAAIMNSARLLDELHELRHTDQWLVLGPLFPVVYGAIWLVTGYQAHPLEADARRWAARQSAWAARMAGER